MSAKDQPSKVEEVKEASNYLRGFVAEEAFNGLPNYSEEAYNILKFHGSYQQDDRDVRVERKKAGLDKAYSMMIRSRIPGGKITAEQYLEHDRLAMELGNRTLRITTRQSFQLHGVLKNDLPTVIRRINEVLLSTLAACGDVERNVLSCPAPIRDDIRDRMQADADLFASHFAPRTNSYWELWLDGEKIDNPLLPQPRPTLIPTPADTEVEPIYGRHYLPRKFKTAFSLPFDNCTDVYANDLGFLAVIEAGQLVGYNVLVGGGLGTTPSNKNTFPHLGKDLCFVTREGVLEIGEAVIKAYRDLGNRADRKRARIKYLVADLGIDAFRSKVEEYLGHPTEPPRPNPVTGVDDHMGWHEQGDGKLFLGIPIENGRVRDVGALRLATALRTLFQTYKMPARLTCQQSILLCDLDPAWRDEINQLLADHGVARVETISTVRRWAMACPAMPTCGLAVTESERVLPRLLDQLEQRLAKLGLADEVFTVRMTGCPNGCARPYNADIGLVGRSAGKAKPGDEGPVAGTYTLFLGGSLVGHRLASLYKDYVPFDRLVDELTPIFARFKTDRQPNETFGDFCDRLGVERLAAIVAEAEANGSANGTARAS